MTMLDPLTFISPSAVKVDRFAIHLFVSDFTEHPGIELGPEEKGITGYGPCYA